MISKWDQKWYTNKQTIGIKPLNKSPTNLLIRLTTQVKPETPTAWFAKIRQSSSWKEQSESVDKTEFK